MRKNYAAFCSMGKCIKIGVLTATYTMVALAGSTNVAAQSPTTHNHSNSTPDSTPAAQQTIDEVTITAAALPAVLQAQQRAGSAWSSAQIATMPVQDIQQLLNHAANIDLRQRSGNGVQADIRMRGGSEEQTLILLNGINIADPRTGHHSLNVPVDLTNVSRIEIVQMPGAFAGAVNIVTDIGTNVGTENAPTTNATAGIGTGSHNWREAYVNLNYVKNALAATAAASLHQSDGYIYNTDFKTINAFAHAVYRFSDDSKIDAQFGFQQKQFGANSFYSVGENEYEHVRTLISSLSYHKNIGAMSLQADVYHRRSYDNYAKHRDSLVFADYDRRQDNYHQGDVLGGDVYAGYISDWGKTTLGVQPRAEHIFSNKLGELMAYPRSFEANIDYTHEKWRTTLTFFLKHVYTYRRLSLAASAVGNASNSFGYYTLANAQAGFRILPQWDVSLTMHQSLRLPTFTDLYYNGVGYLPNPDLKPERATTFEVASQYRRNRLHTNAAVFYRNGSDLIDWVYVDENNTQQCRNHVSIATTGVEAGVGYSFNRYLQNLTLQYAYLHLSSPQTLDERAKGRLFAYLKHKVSVGCAHGLWRGLQLVWSVVYEQRNGSYRSALRGVEPTAFEPLFLVDARLQWQQDAFSLYLSCDNLLDQKYYDYSAVPQAGRWLKAGMRVRF
jgi:iron complex outermembrane receptor protein